MELRVLRYFLTVAREENITRAAELLHVSQPAVSRQLAQLEDSSFQYHLMSAKKNGITKEEIAEILTHAAFYAGWPKAWAAFRLAKEVWKDEE